MPILLKKSEILRLYHLLSKYSSRKKANQGYI